MQAGRVGKGGKATDNPECDVESTRDIRARTPSEGSGRKRKREVVWVLNGGER